MIWQRFLECALVLAVIGVGLLVWWLCARTEECEVSDEPWLTWDGEVPEECAVVDAPAEPLLHDVYILADGRWSDHPTPDEVARAKADQCG